MSTLGPLQKFSFTLLASGALIRICTRPAESIRGYSAPQTLVSAGWNWFASSATQVPVMKTRATASILMTTPDVSRARKNRSRREGELRHGGLDGDYAL